MNAPSKEKRVGRCEACNCEVTIDLGDIEHIPCKAPVVFADVAGDAVNHAALLELKDDQLCTLTRCMREVAGELKRRGALQLPIDGELYAEQLMLARSGKTTPTDEVLVDVAAERRRQHCLWGEQNLPDGNTPEIVGLANAQKKLCSRATRDGLLTWRMLIDEELYEGHAETDLARLRNERVQLAALVVQQIEHIDRRLGERE